MWIHVPTVPLQWLASTPGSVARIREKVPSIIQTHTAWFIAKCLSRNIWDDLCLKSSLMCQNSIKVRPLQSRMFSKLCDERGPEHWKPFAPHRSSMAVARKSCRTCVWEELSNFPSTAQCRPSFISWWNLSWEACIPDRTDMFDLLRQLNLSLQGRDVNNMLLRQNKITAFTKKLNMWKTRIVMLWICFGFCVNTLLKLIQNWFSDIQQHSSCLLSILQSNF